MRYPAGCGLYIRYDGEGKRRYISVHLVDHGLWNVWGTDQGVHIAPNIYLGGR